MRMSAHAKRFSFPRMYRGRRLFWRRSDERGQNTLEAAICMTLFLMVLFGLIELSFVLYTYHAVAESAREGTRYAIVHGSACTPSGCTASASTIESYVEGLGLLNASAMSVTTTWSAGTQSTCSPSASCNNPGNLVQVSVQYQIPLVLPFVKSTNVTMSSTSQMIISQ